ncbi:hypothetical protein BGZ61DRAFT_524257 [Ilyonectria robusta]|uniref:uncharacterized protein n=1 Tax=Ilyonectria robusta TaxID=1079257 RepID=UPI001E8D2BD2|nr:uncharacterized protein BGZ61DRAFT_524257 [Ilyonectria robusta]KAH8654296.1 hypothetical protein BGZ61DRAFT_524257 [Ilyonectria robusta]
MVRSQVADLLILLHERRAQHHLLSDAMQHLDTILRRLPRDSPDRPKYLSNLSYAKMSEYKMTSSRHALDEAVSYGRQANEMAATIDLFHCDLNVYLDIQNNLGFALALRYALIQDPEDLDGAVACAKETYDNASKDSKSYNFSLNNLASRLRMRYLRDQNPDDINEARRLANELRSRTTAGTTEHAAAAAQLGFINAEKFKQTDKLEDLDEALRLSTNEKLMRIDYGNKHVSELRVLTPQNYSQALRQAWEMDAQSTLSGIYYNRNGPIYDQSQQRINPDLVKSWLNNCDHNHSFACNHPRSGKRAENKMRLTLIDVKEECLVSASSDAKYFALSYVWGRSLGERYLWVDAVCMVQDDEVQMAGDIPKMDIVYGQAFATIVALEGTDADAGLPGVCAGTREPQKITTLTISNKSLDLDDDPDSKDVVYFQCGQETLSEGGANEEFEALTFDQAALSDNHILEKANRNNPLCSLDVIYDLTLCERLTKAFNTYTKLVGTYSQRNLSFKSDILKAFAGIFAVLEEHFHVVTLHGLPAAVISHALLWSPAARIPRRGSQLPTNLTLPTSGPDPQFPSWSWVGWDGPVEYRVFEHSKGEMVLPAPRVKVYDTINGPISDIIQGQKGSLEPAHQAPDRTGSPDNGRDDQGGGTGNRPDKEEHPREHVLAKMVPDHFRGSIWIVGAPQVPQDRKDPHIATKLLRFTARTVPLPAFQVMPNKEYLSCMSQVHVRSSQAVRRIQDRNGKHCGLWWEQAGYGYVGLGISPEAESKIDMH